MKTIRKLKTLDWRGYFFKEMVNILDIQTEYFMINNLKVVKIVQQYLMCVIVKKIVYPILFLTI